VKELIINYVNIVKREKYKLNGNVNKLSYESLNIEGV
jgi:hypothetical protein